MASLSPVASTLGLMRFIRQEFVFAVRFVFGAVMRGCG
jgi:hypothetical protein